MTPVLYRGRLSLLTGWLPIAAMLIGCHRDMQDQPRDEPYEDSQFFPDGMASRPVVPGTVAVGQLNEVEPFSTGKQNGQLVQELPLNLSAELLARGRDRYTIFCTACHGQWGNGDGMIVQRGLRAPPTMHSERLRNVPIGHFFDVMTNGFGAMPSYAVQIKPRDRWAIAAYIRALQRSQSASIDDLSESERQQLEQEAAP